MREVNRDKRWALLTTGIILLLLALTSCSGGSHSDDETATSESLYDPGASVSAVGFDEAKSIELSLIDSEGNSTVLTDGNYVGAGSVKLAVKVGGDQSSISRVFVSDGGMNQVEAALENDRYVCEFMVSGESLYQILLVQAIHTSGKASKEKIILRTYSPSRDSGYAKNGIGLLVGKKILDGQKDFLAELLDEKISDVFNSILKQNSAIIKSLSYGDGDASTRDIVITAFDAVDSTDHPDADFHLSFVVKNVTLSVLPLYDQILVDTQGNDLKIDTYVALKDQGSLAGVRFVLDFLGTSSVTFSKPFFCQSAVQEMIASSITGCELPATALDLKENRDILSSLLPDYVTINGNDVDIATLLSKTGSDIEGYLFIDAYGIPDNADPASLAIGLGVFDEDYQSVLWETITRSTPSGTGSVNGVFNSLFDSAVKAAFEEMKQKDSSIKELSYGDGDPNTADCVINSLAVHATDDANIKTVQAKFTIRKVDLTYKFLIFDIISITDNDLTIDAVFDVECRGDGTSGQIAIKTESVSSAVFTDPFLLQSITESTIKQDLQDMEAQSFGIVGLIDGINLSVDVAGALLTQDRYPLFPADASPYVLSPGWTLELADTYNIRCAISQDCINRLLKDRMGKPSEMDAKELLLAVLGKDFPGFSTSQSGAEETVMKLSVQPVVDLSSSNIRLMLPDVMIQYRVSGVPQWEASIDLDLIVTPVVAGGKINFYISPVEGNNHFHVMKDNLGNLGFFDHSDLMDGILKRLPEMLGNSSTDPAISIGLNTWEPTIVLNFRVDPVKISSGSGYLNIDLDALSVDLREYIKLFLE